MTADALWPFPLTSTSTYTLSQPLFWLTRTFPASIIRLPASTCSFKTVCSTSSPASASPPSAPSAAAIGMPCHVAAGNADAHRVFQDIPAGQHLDFLHPARLARARHRPPRKPPQSVPYSPAPEPPLFSKSLRNPSCIFPPNLSKLRSEARIFFPPNARRHAVMLPKKLNELRCVRIAALRRDAHDAHVPVSAYRTPSCMRTR